MSIEKYLNKLDNEVANEGIGGLITAGILAAPFIISAGLIAIAPLIAKYGIKQTENLIEKATEIKISKTTITAMELYINNAMSFKNKADTLFNKGKELLKKYETKIPDNIYKSFLNEVDKLVIDIKKFHDKVIHLLNTESEIIDDITLKNKVIKLNDIADDCYTSRVNDHGLDHELSEIPFVLSVVEDDDMYSKNWRYAHSLVKNLITPYDIIAYQLPREINKNIKILVNKKK
jgi:hypothetical protein